MQFELSLKNSKPVSLYNVLRRVLEDLMPLVEEKNVDIGVISASDAEVLALEIDLIISVKSLLENVIRNTPKNGQIDISHITDGQEIVMKVVVH